MVTLKEVIARMDSARTVDQLYEAAAVARRLPRRDKDEARKVWSECLRAIRLSGTLSMTQSHWIGSLISAHRKGQSLKQARVLFNRRHKVWPDRWRDPEAADHLSRWCFSGSEPEVVNWIKTESAK